VSAHNAASRKYEQQKACQRAAEVWAGADSVPAGTYWRLRKCAGIHMDHHLIAVARRPPRLVSRFSAA